MSVALSFKCPECKSRLRLHCRSKTCNWWLCEKDKTTWVLRILKGGLKPTLRWSNPTYYPEPMGPLPPPSS